MTSPKHPSQPCHNCRRQRRKCDRSVPQCLKCIAKGQECLGYQRLFRWEQGIASRGKMAGKTFEGMTEGQGGHGYSTLQSLSPVIFSDQQISLRNSKFSLLRPLTDPLVKDLKYTSRKYLSYFADVVCRDLVLYDVAGHNAFRDLIPLAPQHPALLQIIIANSALRMSNACQKLSDPDSIGVCSSHHSSVSTASSRSSSPASSSSLIQNAESYDDALSAKQRALCLLNSALINVTSANADATLAVVLLFIEFELMDSGQDDWKHHTSGARTIINTLRKTALQAQTAISPLQSCLISNCAVFDVLGSTFTSFIGPKPSSAVVTDPLTLLQDEEGNHCSSFPRFLLELIQSGAQLLQTSHPSSHFDRSNSSKQQQAVLLLSKARSFDPLAWATNLQPYSPSTDLVNRAHIASAHRAAVCIYLSRVQFSLDFDSQPSNDLENLVEVVITHLSFIHPTSELFKAIMWPAFLAGAETNDRFSQEWVVRRFEMLWEVEPWGLIRGALGVLKRIWTKRSEVVVIDGECSANPRKRRDDWLGDLRTSGVDWLIL